MIPDEAIGADLDRRFVYVVDAEGNVSGQAGPDRARATMATASSAKA